jgi:peptide-methionine (S)-S-oxide reductase
MSEPFEHATFAAGCFWGVEYRFSQIAGVLATRVGYAGGRVRKPSYQQVCTDRTGHAEVVEVQFDPARISYAALLEAFFALHDPTTRNRQGVDVGTHYRSAVFFHTPQQQQQALQVRDALNATRFAGRIVTEIVPMTEFWLAEEYHQKYLDKHPETICSL